MSKSKTIKEYESKPSITNWRSYFNDAKQDMGMWQALSEFIANTILKNRTKPVEISINQSVSKNTKANYLIIDDTSCGITNMKERYDGVWSAAKSYDAEKFEYAKYGTGLIRSTFSLGRLKSMATKTKFDTNVFKVEPDLDKSNGLYDLDAPALWRGVEIDRDDFPDSGTSIWIDTNTYGDEHNPCINTTKKYVLKEIHKLEADWAYYLDIGDLSITYKYTNVDKPNESFTYVLNPEFPKLSHHKNKDVNDFPTNEWEFEKERLETEVNGKKVYVDFTVGRLLSPDTCDKHGRVYGVQPLSPFYYHIDNCGFRIRQNGRIMSTPLKDFKDNSGRDSSWSLFGFIDIYKDCGISATLTKTSIQRDDNWNAIVEKINEFLKEKNLRKRVAKGTDAVQCNEDKIRNQIAEDIKRNLKETNLDKDFNVHTEFALPNGKRIDVFQEHKTDNNKSIIHEVKVDAFSTDDFDAVNTYITLTGVTNVKLWAQKLNKTVNTSSALDLLITRWKTNFKVDLNTEFKDFRKIPGIDY
tara:strand:+ start:86 stop:1663 length:1578 start_codon:yes stop_codon:yes gene_type:complete